MSLQNERIAYLLEAYTSRCATAEEEKELMDWINDTSEDEELRKYVQAVWERLSSGADFDHVDWNNMFNQVVVGPKVIPMTRVAKRGNRRWMRMAVAASLLLVIGIGVYLALSNRKAKPAELAELTVQNDVKAPEANKAMVTLADGRTIYLDNSSNGQLAMQGNVKLVKLNNGQIAYESTGASGTVVNNYNTLSNPRGSKIIDMLLSDGSHVWLNAGSSITFPVAFAADQRSVSVTGEAYFEIAHDASKPFRVKKGDWVVSVLGTHFNVNAYDDESSVKVTLLEGAVNVTKGDVSKQLRPGQQAQIEKNIEVLNDVDLEHTMAWKNGLFSFKDTPLQEIMRQLERWYDVTVKYDGQIPDRSFGGKIHRESNISDVLRILAESDVHYKLNNKEITILP